MIRFHGREGEFVSIFDLFDWVRAHPLTDGRSIPTMLWGSPGIGKCVTGTTSVVIDGSLTSIDDLWRRFEGSRHLADPDVPDGEWVELENPLTSATLNSDGRMAEGRVVRLYRQRVREVGRRVVLDDGSQIVMTQRHRLHGLDGWQRELAAGDHVCVPARIPWSRGKREDLNLIRLLAWQIAEGFESGYSCAITQKDQNVLRSVRDSAERFAENAEINLNSMPCYWETGGKAHRLVISSAAYRRYLEARGYMWGKRSADKQIPDFIVSADDETLKAFLREYVAAEGHMNPQGTLEVSSASKILVQQLQFMCRRLGIWMRIREVQKAATNGSGIKRAYWLGLVSGTALRGFRDEIGIGDPRKAAEMERICARNSNTNTDVVPLGDLVSEVARLSGLPMKRLGLRSDYCGLDSKRSSRLFAQAALAGVGAVVDGSAARNFHSSQFARQLTNSDQQRVRAAFGALASADRQREIADLHQRMQARAEREVHYARVTKVEPVMLDEYVYDLEVEGGHNYVGGGMLTHNTQIIKAYCRERDIGLRVYAPAHDVTGGDIVGRAYTDEETGRTRYALPSWLPTEQSEPEGLLFIDELNRANPEVLAGLMEPLGEGTIAQSGWEIPDGWSIVCAANPAETGHAVQKLDTAMVNRMLHFAPGWDPPSWAAWAKGVGVDPAIINYALRWREEHVEVGTEELPLEMQDKLRCSPRTLEYFGALYEPGMPAGLLRVVTEGLMGREQGAQFIADLSSPDAPIPAEVILTPPTPEPLGGKRIFTYDEILDAWANQLGSDRDSLIIATGELLLAALVEADEPRIVEIPNPQTGDIELRPDVHKEPLAQLAGRFLARLDSGLREHILVEARRSVPQWADLLSESQMIWQKSFAQSRAQGAARKGQMPQAQRVWDPATAPTMGPANPHGELPAGPPPELGSGPAY